MVKVGLSIFEDACIDLMSNSAGSIKGVLKRRVHDETKLLERPHLRCQSKKMHVIGRST